MPTLVKHTGIKFISDQAVFKLRSVISLYQFDVITVHTFNILNNFSRSIIHPLEYIYRDMALIFRLSINHVTTYNLKEREVCIPEVQVGNWCD